MLGLELDPVLGEQGLEEGLKVVHNDKVTLR